MILYKILSVIYRFIRLLRAKKKMNNVRDAAIKTKIHAGTPPLVSVFSPKTWPGWTAPPYCAKEAEGLAKKQTKTIASIDDNFFIFPNKNCHLGAVHIE